MRGEGVGCSALLMLEKIDAVPSVVPSKGVSCGHRAHRSPCPRFVGLLLKIVALNIRAQPVQSQVARSSGLRWYCDILMRS